MDYYINIVFRGLTYLPYVTAHNQNPDAYQDYVIIERKCFWVVDELMQSPSQPFHSFNLVYFDLRD